MKPKKQNKRTKTKRYKLNYDLIYGKPKKQNPENFDDGLTQVAPKGEFKSGDIKNRDKEIEDEIIKKAMKTNTKIGLEENELYDMIKLAVQETRKETLEEVKKIVHKKHPLRMNDRWVSRDWLYQQLEKLGEKKWK